MTDPVLIARLRDAARREAISGANAGFRTVERDRAFTRADTLYAIADELERDR